MQRLSVRLQQAAPIPLDASFECGPGELLALLGPSGSGKTTLLRMIAGLAPCAHGVVKSGNTCWLDTEQRICLAPQVRKVGMVFQNYALFPHLSARDNVALASARADAKGHAAELLARVRLTGFEQRLPAQLSGGQQQRVALARALAREPDALLLDEPFSAVDQTTRLTLYDVLTDLRSELITPIVLVTHDLSEAQRLADRIVVLDHGTVVASGVAGDPHAFTHIDRKFRLEPASWLYCRVASHDDVYGLTRLALDAEIAIQVPRIDAPLGTPVRLRVAARDVALSLSLPVDLSIGNRIRGEVQSLERIDTTHVDVTVRLTSGARLGARVTAEAVDRLQLASGKRVWCLVKSVAMDRPAIAVAGSAQAET